MKPAIKVFRAFLIVLSLFLVASAEAIERPAAPLRETVPGLRIETRAYPDYAATEWQFRLRAPEAGDPPLYENLKSADFEVVFPTNATVILHWSKGSRSEPCDFEPKTEPLAAGKPFSLESFGGRSSDGVMPYFNLAGAGGGLIVAIGWTGDWKVSFERQINGSVRITAGLKRTRFHLAPGEEVRLPSILAMNYTGDWIDGQNRFRRLMLAHFTPKNHLPMTLMPVQAGVHGIYAFNETTEEKLVKLAADIDALKLPLDCYHLDAGWNEGGFPRGQGNPQADPVRFPNGLAPVGAAVRETGMRFLAWFEPERAMPGTWLEREHPGWLLKPTDTPERLRYQERDGFLLLDLGNPEARHWAIESVSEEVTRSRLEFYRHDFNLYPAYFWHTDENPDEIGLREIRHINGLYTFLDELARRHPDLILDNCAAGGRRLDFEMMRRCIVLWRSDNTWGHETFPQNVQAMTHGLSHWLPLHGLGADATDDLALRSGMGACGGFSINFRNPNAVAALRKHLVSYLKVRPIYTGDFYPLTPHSLDTTSWIAWQFHRADLGESVVQAFRRPDSLEETLAIKLRGLDPKQRYEIENIDEGKEIRAGEELMRGFVITLREKSDAAVLVMKAIE
jgi:alpha-galactosidase